MAQPEFESDRPDIKSQALTHSYWPLFNNSSKKYSLTVKPTPLNFIDTLKVQGGPIPECQGIGCIDQQKSSTHRDVGRDSFLYSNSLGFFQIFVVPGRSNKLSHMLVKSYKMGQYSMMVVEYSRRTKASDGCFACIFSLFPTG